MLSIFIVSAAIVFSQPDFVGHSTQLQPRQLKNLAAPTLPVTRSPIKAAAAQNKNAIGGFIFDRSRRPVANLRIELLNEVDSVIANTRSDSSGRYSFYNLSQGTFQVRVITDGTNLIGQTVRVQISKELFPTYYQALERLGAEYVKRQQYEPAVAILNAAIEVNPKGSSSFYALGVAQYYLKQISEAIKSLRHSMSLAPDSANSAFLQMYLGMALLKSGKTDEAETCFKQAHEKGGKLVPDVHMHLAQIYSNGKRYREAADEWAL
jgi:tetratricopeptide (TPR) repeat protein